MSMANRERSNSFNTIKYFILNATTYLTNTEINGSESTEVKVVPNEQITIEVQAVDYNEGISHIKTLTIGKDTIQVDKNKTYSNDALVITEDTDIFVEFVTEYTVTANAEEGGRITINGNSNTSVTLD
jgi:hypothetical protein